MADNQNVFALFADMMGFAHAILALTDEEHAELERFIVSGVVRPGSSPRATALAFRYDRFHRHLNSYADLPAAVDVAHVSFSDSAYIVMKSATRIHDCAARLMRLFYKDEIPVRIGIGRGSFSRLTFAVSSAPAGELFARAPFFGSAIVRAYKAQDAKTCLGFRAFLHPSAVVAPIDSEVAPLEDVEKNEHCTHEINLVGRWPGKDYLKRLKAMRQGVTNARALEHYDGSVAAILRLDAWTKNRQRSKSKATREKVI